MNLNKVYPSGSRNDRASSSIEGCPSTPNRAHSVWRRLVLLMEYRLRRLNGYEPVQTAGCLYSPAGDDVPRSSWLGFVPQDEEAATLPDIIWSRHRSASSLLEALRRRRAF